MSTSLTKNNKTNNKAKSNYYFEVWLHDTFGNVLEVFGCVSGVFFIAILCFFVFCVDFKQVSTLSKSFLIFYTPRVSPPARKRLTRNPGLRLEFSNV